MNLDGNKNSVVREFAATLLNDPLWDGGRVEDDAIMASDKMPVLGLSVDRDFSGPARGGRNPDAVEAGWWLKHKDYAGKVPAGEGHSALPSE